jgi:hypothetical protein
MTDATTPTPADLSGTADERMKQLQELGAAPLTAEWLRRQLDAVLVAWAADETELDIDREARTDF